MKRREVGEERRRRREVLGMKQNKSKRKRVGVGRVLSLICPYLLICLVVSFYFCFVSFPLHILSSKIFIMIT